jgi:hypothetical protein
MYEDHSLNAHCPSGPVRQELWWKETSPGSAATDSVSYVALRAKALLFLKNSIFGESSCCYSEVFNLFLACFMVHISGGRALVVREQSRCVLPPTWSTGLLFPISSERIGLLDTAFSILHIFHNLLHKCCNLFIYISTESDYYYYYGIAESL